MAASGGTRAPPPKAAALGQGRRPLRLPFQDTSSWKVRVFPADSNSGNFQEQGCPFPKGVDWTLALTPTSSARAQAGPPGQCIVGTGLWLPSPCHLAPACPLDLGLGMECPGCCRQGQIGGGALSATLGPAHLSLLLPQQSVAAICGSGGLVWTLWPTTGRASGSPLGATCSQTIRSGIKDPPLSRLSTDHQLWDRRGARVRLPILPGHTEGTDRGCHSWGRPRAYTCLGM